MAGTMDSSLDRLKAVLLTLLRIMWYKRELLELRLWRRPTDHRVIWQVTSSQLLQRQQLARKKHVSALAASRQQAATLLKLSVEKQYLLSRVETCRRFPEYLISRVARSRINYLNDFY